MKFDSLVCLTDFAPLSMWLGLWTFIPGKSSFTKFHTCQVIWMFRLWIGWWHWSLWTVRCGGGWRVEEGCGNKSDIMFTSRAAIRVTGSQPNKYAVISAPAQTLSLPSRDSGSRLEAGARTSSLRGSYIIIMCKMQCNHATGIISKTHKLLLGWQSAEPVNSEHKLALGCVMMSLLHAVWWQFIDIRYIYYPNTRCC